MEQAGRMITLDTGKERWTKETLCSLIRQTIKYNSLAHVCSLEGDIRHQWGRSPRCTRLSVTNSIAGSSTKVFGLFRRNHTHIINQNVVSLAAWFVLHGDAMKASEERRTRKSAFPPESTRRQEKDASTAFSRKKAKRVCVDYWFLPEQQTLASLVSLQRIVQDAPHVEDVPGYMLETTRQSVLWAADVSRSQSKGPSGEKPSISPALLRPPGDDGGNVHTHTHTHLWCRNVHRCLLMKSLHFVKADMYRNIFLLRGS